MKLAELTNRNVKRYILLPKETDRVWTLNYFEEDSMWDDAHIYSDIRIIPKEEYLAKKNEILEELEDYILRFDNDFSANDAYSNLEGNEFVEAEHQFI